MVSLSVAGLRGSIAPTFLSSVGLRAALENHRSNQSGVLAKEVKEVK